MITSRREFLDRLAASGIILSGLPAALGALPESLGAEEPSSTLADEFDIKWPAKLTGKIRAVYDVPEIDSGYGVWRASIWANQYSETHKVPVSTTSTAVVLRHTGIMLAMQQAFWDKYGVGKLKGATHPMTGEMTNRNPALMGVADGVPEPFASFAIPSLIQRGGVVLACNLALQMDAAALIQKTDGVSPEEATKQARAMLIPGVILQPSGVYAAILAQAAGGAQYVHSN